MKYARIVIRHKFSEFKVIECDLNTMSHEFESISDIFDFYGDFHYELCVSNIIWADRCTKHIEYIFKKS